MPRLFQSINDCVAWLASVLKTRTITFAVIQLVSLIG